MGDDTPEMTAPLPDLPWLEGLFVQADLEAVASRFRGEMAAVIESEGTPQYEVSGAAAGIGLPLGPDKNSCVMMPDQHAVSIREFKLRGFARVSRLRCNPDWTLVEGPYGLGSDQYMFDDWLGVPSLNVWSGNFTNLAVPVGDDGPSVMHGFSYHAEGTNKRWVEYLSNIHDGTRFRRRGKALPFEDISYYEARQKRDRMTRAILFEILAKLGIDGISVFGRRELDDPLLYTADHEGQSCVIYEADRQRYVAWMNRPPPWA